MIKITKKILREPLFHFILLGGLVYIYFSFVHKADGITAKQIVLSSFEVQKLKSSFEKEYKRKVDTKLLKILIERRYYESILLDKAFSLKIAQNDKIVSQRLLQKMQFLMLDSSKYKEPTQEELEKFYTKNIEDYSHIKTLSFSSIYFHNDKDRHIEEVYELLQISKVKWSDAEGLSESSSLPYHVEKATFTSVAKEYGKYFAKKLFTLTQGSWHKAIQTKDGARIVYVTEKEVGKPYSFEDVESRVYEDYVQMQQIKQKEKAYAEMASQYSLSVE